MRVLVASSSVFRQVAYCRAVEAAGHAADIVSGGVECIARLRQQRPDLLILEARLFWGGADGVLQAVQDQCSGGLPVILVAVGAGPIDWLQLSRFRIDNFLFRVPSAQELKQAIAGIAAQQAMDGKLRPAKKSEDALA